MQRNKMEEKACRLLCTSEAPEETGREMIPKRGIAGGALCPGTGTLTPLDRGPDPTPTMGGKDG